MSSPQNFLGLHIWDSHFVEFWGQRIQFDELYDTDDSGYIVGNKTKGVCISLDKDLLVNSMTFFSNENSKVNRNYKCYQGILPAGIRFGMSVREVESILGEPIKQNKKFKSLLGVDIRPWHHYECEGYYLTVEFDKSYSYVVTISIGNEEL